ERTNQFAHALHGLGVKQGERVFLVLPNSPHFIISYYAVLKIGGVVVLPNPDADASGIMAEIKQTEARVVITLMQYEDLAKGIRQHLTIDAVVLANIH